jgi:hypothetical protein
MKKCLLFFCAYIVCLNAAPFYQNPSPEAAYHLLQTGQIDQVAEVDKPFVLDLATTFIAQIIKVHPDYAEAFARDFSQLSAAEQEIFLQAFAMIGIQDPRVQGNGNYQILPLSRLDHLEFKTGHDFDLMVVSFLATGDEVFLRQPMAFLNSDPELLFFAYEWNNRQALSKLLEELTGQSKLPDENEFLDILKEWPNEKQVQFTLKLTAWKCLDFIRGEDPTAEEKISQLGKTDPLLDYQGTLANLLK